MLGLQSTSTGSSHSMARGQGERLLVARPGQFHGRGLETSPAAWRTLRGFETAWSVIGSIADRGRCTVASRSDQPTDDGTPDWIAERCERGGRICLSRGVRRGVAASRRRRTIDGDGRLPRRPPQSVAPQSHVLRALLSGLPPRRMDTPDTEEGWRRRRRRAPHQRRARGRIPRLERILEHGTAKGVRSVRPLRPCRA